MRPGAVHGRELLARQPEGGVLDAALGVGRRVRAVAQDVADGRVDEIKTTHTMSAEHITWFRAGSALNAGQVIDPATGTLGIEALFPNPSGLLRPGQFGRVRAPVTTRANAILVPQRAVREMQGTFSVGVLKADSTVEVRPVKAGARVGSDWVVDTGLAAGTVIVVEGMQKVRPGVKVRATQAAAPADTARVTTVSDTSKRP